MIRSLLRTLVLASLLLPLAATLGCDQLSVHSFAGATLQFTLSAPAITPAGQHLEVWARNANNDIIRIEPFYDQNAYLTTPGLIIRTAISPDDPCMTDDKGNLLTSADAYPGPVKFGSVTQSPAQQAQQIQQRIAQLNPMGMPALKAVLPWDHVCSDPKDPKSCVTNTPAMVPMNPTPEQRKAACDVYRGSDLAYVPNPLQITAPLHGAVYGFTDFLTMTPPTNYNGFRLDTKVSLKGLQEIFFTIEGDTVDATMRGPLYLVSKRVPGGVDVLQFQLSEDPTNPSGASGAVAVYTDLDQDPVQF
jgi:hypothetical protein